MSSFINTVKSTLLPLKDEVKNITRFNDLMTAIKRRFMNGHTAIITLYQMNGVEDKIGLVTGKCLENMQNFIITSKVVLDHHLARY